MKKNVYHVGKNIEIAITPISEHKNEYLFCLASIINDSKLIGFIYYYGQTPVQTDIGVLAKDEQIILTCGGKKEWIFETSVFGELMAKEIGNDLYWLPVKQIKFNYKSSDTNSYSYSIETYTSLDYLNTMIEGRTDVPSFQNNVFLMIENAGDEDATINDILINGRSWRTFEGIIKDIGIDASDEISFEEIKKIWDFVRKKISCGETYQHLFNDEMSKISIVDFFNNFGTGACGTYNSVLTLLCSACGIPSRRGSLSDGSHVVSQVKWNSKDIVLDAFYGADYEGEGIRGSFFINHNGEPASYDDLCQDHYLVNRSGRLRIGELASLFGYHDSWQNKWTENYFDSKSMKVLLHSGEIIKWNIHPIYSRENNQTCQTGIFKLSNKLSGKRFKTQNLVINENTVEANESGGLYSKICLPHPIYGINCSLLLNKGKIRIAISTNSGSIYREYTCKEGDEPSQIDFSPDKNECGILFNDITEDAEISIISYGRTSYDIQNLECLFYVYGKSMALLKNGINECHLNFSNENCVKNVVVTHGMIEFPAHPMNAPQDIAAEECNDKSDGKIMKIILDSPKNSKNPYDGFYEYIISTSPECSVPISPKYQEQTVEREILLYNDGIMKPGVDYYAKTRYIDHAGTTSPWSKTTNFSFSAIPTPVWDNAEYLQNGVRIKWKPVKVSGQTVYYDIYGSCEKGFTPSKTPYDVWVKRIDDPAESDRYPANFICTTTKTSLIVPYDNEVDMIFPAHFRITARTNKANSATSEALSLATPYILKSSIPSLIHSGQPLSCIVKTILSKGSLHFNRLPDKPINTSFLDKEIPFFELAEGPPWLNINSYEGCLYGTPGIQDCGHHSITIVCNTHLGSCKTETSIEVI